MKRGFVAWYYVFIGIFVTVWVFAGYPQLFNDYLGSFPPDVLDATAANGGQLAIYRDSNGTFETNVASYTGVPFNAQQQQDSIFTQNANDIDVDLGVSGHYLFGYTVQARDDSFGDRISWLTQTTLDGTAQVFGHGQGYRRNASNDRYYAYGFGMVNASAGDDFRVEVIRQGDNTNSHLLEVDRSSLWLLKLDDAWEYLRLQGADNQATQSTMDTIDFTTETENTDTGETTYSHSTGSNPEQVTLKQTGHYLVTYNVGVDGSSNRTSITSRLTLNNVPIEQSYDYTYIRNSNSTSHGTTANMAIVNVTSTDSILRLEWGATGAVSAYGTDTRSDRTGITIVKLPDSADYLRVHDGAGTQTINGTATTALTFDTEDEADSGSFSYNTGTGVTTIQQDGDYLFTTGMRTNRGTSGSTRLTRAGAWHVNGTRQTVGNTGAYIRGDQGTPDTFDGGWSAAGIFSLSNTNTIDFRYIDDGDNGNSADTVQADSAGITAVNLDTLFARGFEQSAYRWFDNADGTGVGDNPLAAQDTAATAPAQGTPFRLRMLLHVASSTADVGVDNFKLQFAQKSGTCDTGFTGESYADVASGSGVIRYYDNTSPDDGDLLTATSTDPTHSSHTIVNQTYEESNNFTVTSTIAVGQDGKWDFALVDNSATAETSYCFRIVKSDDSTLDVYSVIPEITTASGGSSWWDDTMSYRRKITFDTTSSATTTNLTNFPVAVHLNSSRVDYANTQNSGQDIRFVDSDDSTMLQYEIEQWNESGTSTVWVKVPQVDQNSSTDFIWMYYGNGSTSTAATTTGVWDDNFTMVHHLQESVNNDADGYVDSTQYNNDGTGTSMALTEVAGIAGTAQDLDGTADLITVSHNANLNPGAGPYTMEGWIKHSDPNDKGAIVSKGSTSNSNISLAWCDATGGCSNGDTLRSLYASDSSNREIFDGEGDQDDGEWHYAAITIASNSSDFWVDMSKYQTKGTDVGSPSYSASDDLYIGALLGSTFSSGQYDEIRISDVARTDDWLEFTYCNIKDTCNTYGSEETNPNGTLTFVVDTTSVSFPSLSPSVLVATTSILSIDTDNTTGFYITIERDDSDTTLDLTTDAGVNITDKTEWIAPAATTTSGNATASTTEPQTLQFRIRQTGTDESNYASSWWGSDDSTTNALFAGIPSSTASISNKTIINRSTQTSGTSTAYVLYNLDVSVSQETGSYDGGITLTATVNP